MNIKKKTIMYIKAYIVKFINLFMKIDKVSIGSGRRNWFGWDLLDRDEYPTITYTLFTNNTKLKKKKYRVIFCSHFIEHIESDVFLNLLDEIKKSSDGNTKIFFKYPNFEMFYDAFHSNNIEDDFLEITNDQYSHVVRTWINHNVLDNRINRISMMFCDYSNFLFGHPYLNKSNNLTDDQSYHGPAKISEKKLREVFREKDFKKISKQLQVFCLKDKDFHVFNHMNPWHIEDLKKIFIDKNFKIISQDPKEIFNEFKGDIPKNEILYLEQWSHLIYLKI